MKLASALLLSTIGVAVAQEPSMMPSVSSESPTVAPVSLASDPPTTTQVDSSSSPTVAPAVAASNTPTAKETTMAPSSPPTATEAVPDMSMPPTMDPVTVNPSAASSLEPTGVTVDDSVAPTASEAVSAAPTDGVTLEVGSPAPSPNPTQSSVPSGAPTSFSEAPSSTPTLSTAPSISAMPSIPRQCSAHPACAGVDNDCCPTVDDEFLYCCFESDIVNDYSKEFTLVDPSPGSTEEATYFISTSTYFDPATAPNGDYPVINYVRDPNEIYDMVYFKTSAIGNAGDFVSGTKKLYMDIYTSAPLCSQIILQFDNLGASTPTNYPVGRHSRYLATTTKQDEWERLQFDFLDRPDGVLGDDQIDSIALFFTPGLKRADSYFFRNFDVDVQGCTENCESLSAKTCSALSLGEEGACADGIDNDNDGLIDCEDSECTLDEACTASVTLAYASASNRLQSVNSSARGYNLVVGAVLCMCMSLALFL